MSLGTHLGLDMIDMVLLHRSWNYSSVATAINVRVWKYDVLVVEVIHGATKHLGFAADRSRKQKAVVWQIGTN